MGNRTYSDLIAKGFRDVITTGTEKGKSFKDAAEKRFARVSESYMDSMKKKARFISQNSLEIIKNKMKSKD